MPPLARYRLSLMRSAYAVFLTFLVLHAFAQKPASPSFRLVLPNTTGSLLIPQSPEWRLDRAVVYDKGQRPVVQLSNDKIGVIASYILDNEPQYNDTSEMCRNDVLGTLMRGPLARATVTNKQSGTRTLANGQLLLTGSYLVEKVEGHDLHQQNMFGFISAHHVCAELHLSRSGFRAGDEKLFEDALNSFTFEPDYKPTPEDFAFFAKLLPPDMAAFYKSSAEPTTKAPSTSKGQSLDLALAGHPGLVHMDAPNFEAVEYSAKPGGREFGIRAVDRQLRVEALAFLFLPDPPQPTAIACRDWMLRSEEKAGQGYGKVCARRTGSSKPGAEYAEADYEPGKSGRILRRYFVAKGDLCADISLFGDSETALDVATMLPETLRFDPEHQPDFFERFRYAQVLYDHHDFAAAAPVYESALNVVDSVPDHLKWRRVTTDQSGIAYGMAGNIKRARAIFQASIAKDPDYPMYYYNLACADAEEHNTAAARTHLQQAFDRRANTLPGEKLPDPAADDSILKLKTDGAFWAFVQSLPKN